MAFEILASQEPFEHNVEELSCDAQVGPISQKNFTDFAEHMLPGLLLSTQLGLKLHDRNDSLRPDTARCRLLKLDSLAGRHAEKQGLHRVQGANCRFCGHFHGHLDRYQ